MGEKRRVPGMISTRDESLLRLVVDYGRICTLQVKQMGEYFWVFSRKTEFASWTRELWFKEGRWFVGRRFRSRSVIHISTPVLSTALKWLLVPLTMRRSQYRTRPKFIFPSNRLAPGWSIVTMDDGAKTLRREDGTILLMRANVDDPYLVRFSHLLDADVEDLLLSLTDIHGLPALSDYLAPVAQGIAPGTAGVFEAMLTMEEVDEVLDTLAAWAEEVGMRSVVDDYSLRIKGRDWVSPGQTILWRIRGHWRILQQLGVLSDISAHLKMAAGPEDVEIALRWFIKETGSLLRSRDQRRLDNDRTRLPHDPAPGWKEEKILDYIQRLVTPEGVTIAPVLHSYNFGGITHLLDVNPRDMAAAYQDPDGGCLAPLADAVLAALAERRRKIQEERAAAAAAGASKKK